MSVRCGRWVMLGLWVGALLALPGCVTTGMSNHEFGEHSFNQYLYSLPSTPRPAGGVQVQTPLKLGVAQVGELTPAPPLMSALKGAAELCGHPVTLPARFAEGSLSPQVSRYGNRYTNSAAARDSNEPPVDQAKLATDALLSLAQSQGLTHLLLVGGAVDVQELVTDRTVWNWSIIGAYLMPSHELTARGTAMAVLVEVDSGRVLMLSQSNSEGRRDEPTVTADAGMKRLVLAQRDELAQKLGAQVVEDLRRLVR